MIRHCCGCMGRASVALGLAIASAVALAGGVSVKIDTSSPDKGPFPSDRFTRLDFSQNTFLHVRLPKPDCNARPSDCADIDVLNTLDGFNVQPRITVPFTGAIDVNTVENPYVQGTDVRPAAGRAYLDRSRYRNGMAVAGGTLVRAFASVGWLWGGRWAASPDYQHFSRTGG